MAEPETTGARSKLRDQGPDFWEEPTPKEVARARRMDWALSLGLAGGVLVAVYYASALDALEFDQRALMNLGNVMAPLIVVAAFIERGIEVILTPLLGDESESLQKQIAEAKPGEDVSKLKKALLQHKHRTRRIAFIFAVGLGLISSLVGVRAISNLVVTPASVPTPMDMLDVVLTGLLLAGGADGMHKLAKVFTSYTDLITKTNEEKRKQAET